MSQSDSIDGKTLLAQPDGLIGPDRVWVIAHCWLVVAPLMYLWDLLQQTRSGWTNGAGRPLGDDFINYWSAAYLAWHGRVADIYNFDAFHAFERSITGPSLQFYHYSYPPILFLLSAPFGFMPYLPALFVWLAASWYVFYRALKLTAYPHALLLSLATPALLVNAIGGQNGAWSAALLGGGLSMMQRRPIAAGILFGLLAYKPQLGLLLPIALIAGRQWRVIIAASVTASSLLTTSVVLFGASIWPAYSSHVEVLRAVILEDGNGVWHRMISVFVFVHRLGFGVMGAYVVQAAATLLTAFFVARSWWRDDAPEIRYALLVLGTFLATPYILDYDLVIGAFVVVWLLDIKARSDIPLWKFQIAIAAILILPLLAAGIGKLTGFAVGPLAIAPVFALVVVASQRNASELKVS